MIARTGLGRHLEVSVQGFGAMAVSGVYGAASPAEGLAAVNHAIDIGVTLIDTADVYGDGQNEELLSKILKTRRYEVTLATKFGITGSFADGSQRARGDAAYVREAVDRSLRRLGIDTIDLSYLHRRDLSVPIEETVGAMAELVAKGKIRHLGLSEVTSSELEAAVAVHEIAAVQSEWSVWSRDVERTVVPTAARLGVGFVPYSPLGRGFLTGTVAPSDVTGQWRGSLPRFAGDAMTQNQAVVDVLRGIAADSSTADRAVTPAQVALAWLYAKGREFGVQTVPIPGSRRPERIDENAAATTLTLTGEQIATLDAVSAAVVGSRSGSADPNWTSEGREPVAG